MVNSHNTGSTFIFFELANTTYGIPSGFIQQMEMVNRITPVPQAPPFVEGVVFSRGQVIPVLNLRVKFGLEKIPYNLRTRLIVICVNQRTVGLIVDTAREFLSLPNEAMQPTPEGISGCSRRYLSGIATLGERVILLLNIEALLNGAEAVNPLNLTGLESPG